MKIKFNREVKSNILTVTGTTFLLAAVMVLIFALAGYYNTAVLWGAVIGSTLASLNFFLMALTLQKVADSKKSGKAAAGLSYVLRNLMLLLGAAVAIVFLKVNPAAFLLPYIFPRVAIMFIQIKLSNKNSSSKKERDDNNEC